MTKSLSLIYDCPCCGQGGLELVRIKSSPPVEAAICSECDRIWPAPHKVGVRNDAELGVTLSHLGLSENWSNIEHIHPGVFWDHLDASYQSTLKNKIPEEM
jgi:uncharacterized Zn finger protein